MKLLAIVSIAIGISCSAFAAPTPASGCRVRINGQETIFGSAGDDFFQTVSQLSRSEGCTYGKIFHAAGSGRVYEDGRLVADPQTGKKRGLTVAEAKRAKQSTGMRCTEYSCDEIGVLRGNEPVENELPSAPVVIIDSGSGW
jgi:hypothetical protein